MRAVRFPQRTRSARRWPRQGRSRSGAPGPISAPSSPMRSGRLQDEVRLEAGFLCAPHYRPQEDGFEFTAVIGEVAMRLAEDGNDLRHFEPELAVLVGERGAMTLRLVLLAFDRVRPDLDALPGQGSPFAGAAHGAAHPEATLADPLHDRRALAVVVRPARHRLGRCEAVRACRQQQAGDARCQNAGGQGGAARGEEASAIEYDRGHVGSSWRASNGAVSVQENAPDAQLGRGTQRVAMTLL